MPTHLFGWSCLSAATVAVATAFLACADFSASPGNSDAAAAADDAALDDGGPDVAARPCDLTKKFDKGVPVPGLATPDVVEGGARFTADERTVFFSNLSFGQGDAGTFLIVDIYTATRPSADAGFGPATLVKTVSTSSLLETSPAIAPDGTLFFARSAVATNTDQETIWTGTLDRTSAAPEFTGVMTMPGPVNFGDTQSDPYVLSDGSALYFDSTRGGKQNLYRGAFVNGAIPVVDVVPGIEARAKESLSSPVVTLDELTIYWGSTFTGDQTEIYVATRSDKASPFSHIHPVAELDTLEAAEIPTFVSADGCRLYYESAPPQDPNVHGDIFVATKPK